MTGIFNEIKQNIHGVIGSYLTNRKGDMLANDVPPLFENELMSVSQDLFQLVDFIMSEKKVNSIEVTADQGYIYLGITDEFILGTFTSKHADGSLLSHVIDKAIMDIGPSDFSPSKTDNETPSKAKVVDDQVRVALCQAVKGKIRILYGDKMAETKLSEAFEQVGASRDTRKKEELKAVFDIIASGLMAKMMGKEKARKFVDDLYQEHELI